MASRMAAALHPRATLPIKRRLQQGVTNHADEGGARWRRRERPGRNATGSAATPHDSVHAGTAIMFAPQKREPFMKLLANATASASAYSRNTHVARQCDEPSTGRNLAPPPLDGGGDEAAACSAASEKPLGSRPQKRDVCERGSTEREGAWQAKLQISNDTSNFANSKEKPHQPPYS